MKTVLITGASRGIGRACALAFAREGYAVAACWHKNEAAARSLLDELSALGCDAELYCADVADPASVEAMAAAAEKRFGHIDALVNNAGIAQQKLFTDLTAADWDRMLSVNAGGVFHTCRCVLPGMLRRHSGRIVNISSIWGISGASCEVHYSASKAAVIGFTRALAQEVGPSGVTVNCVAPGVIDTEMNANLSPETLAALCGETPLCRIGSPEEVADAVVFLCGGKARFITGQVLKVDGGFLGG